MSVRLAKVLRQKAAEFDDHLRRCNYSPTTRGNYARSLRLLVQWAEDEEDLHELLDLTPANLARFWEYTCSRRPQRNRRRGQKTLSFTSLRLYGTVVKLFFKELTRRGELLHDPSCVITLPRTTHSVKGEVLSRREVLKLLMAIPLDSPEGLRDRAVVELLYSTGIRRGELLGIDLGELDLEEGWLRVLGKGDKERFVPVGREAELALRTYLREARPRLASPSESSLFVSHRGTRYTGRQLKELLHDLADKAGIKKRVTPHVFRHTCATHMLAGKADIRYVQALLGHASLSSTQVYTHVDLSQLRQVLLSCHPRERDL